MVKLKLEKSLAKENYVKNLVYHEIVYHEEHKFDAQLINDLMNFIEMEITEGKYSKKDFDKSKILQDIIVSVFGDLSDSELK